jgi:hypothetical protein
MLLHEVPLFPAEATARIPAARSAAKLARSVFASQPSEGGQFHELLTMFGAFEGSPSCSGSPP